MQKFFLRDRKISINFSFYVACADTFQTRNRRNIFMELSVFTVFQTSFFTYKPFILKNVDVRV